MVKSILRKVILGLMALMCILTLCFTIIGLRGYGHDYYGTKTALNGFDMLAMQESYFITGSSFQWALVLYGMFSIMELLMAIPAIIFACINIKNEKTAFKVLVFVFSMVIAGLYMLEGIVLVIVFNSITKNYYASLIETACFVPIILQVIFVVG